MPANATAILSTIAAFFSAVAAVVLMRIGHRDSLESTRPELVLTGWSRQSKGQGKATHDVIAFRSIRNAGRGSAFNVNVFVSETANNRPTALLSGTSTPIRLAILEVDETQEVNGEIAVWWKNVETSIQGKQKYLNITVRILCWETKKMRHETLYYLMATEPSESPIFGGDTIAPGVTLSYRKTISKPIWRLKLAKRIRRIPVIRRFFRRKGSD